MARRFDDDLNMSGGMGKGPSDDDNTLRSQATAKVLYVLGEGEVEGIENGLKQILMDDTRVQASDGSYNIENVKIYERTGTSNQSYIHAFDKVETLIPVGVGPIEHAVPATQDLTDESFTSARVTVQFPSLFNSTDDGMKKFSVQFKIEVKYAGGSWTNPFVSDTSDGTIEVNGKNTSPYEAQFEFKLPRAPSGSSNPWSVRLTRVSEDTSSDKKQDDIYFATLVGIIDRKLNYPDTALLGLELQARNFDGSIPRLSVILKGRKIRIPSNYNPVTRNYSGVWDGTFVRAYTNNPAWIYYDIAENRRFGMGSLIDQHMIDKWSLYSIAKVCDEMVPDGYGGTEPRFTVNAVITEAKEAYDLMQQIASAFRGMSYWSSGALTATQDVLSDPVALLNRSNVINGEFDYSSSSLSARHTVVYVKYKDALDDYKDAMEIVTDRTGLLLYGERVKEVTAFGCTSRGAARRLGLWILYTELHETQTVTFKAGLDQAHRRPGEIIYIMDKEVSALDWGGRVMAGSTTSRIYLDRSVHISAGPTYTMNVILPDGSVASKTVTDGAGDYTDLHLGSALGSVPIDGASWILSSTAVEPKKWRIVSVLETDPHIYTITALEVYEPKYTLIDEEATFTVPNYRADTKPGTPTNLTAEEYYYHKDGVPKAGILFSWSHPAGELTPMYRVRIDEPGDAGDEAKDEWMTQRVRDCSFDLKRARAGDYKITVQTMGSRHRISDKATLTFTAQGRKGLPTFTADNLEIVGETGTNVFTQKNVTIKWDPTIDKGPVHSLSYKQSRIKVYDNTNTLTPVLLRTQIVKKAERFKYTAAMNKADMAAAGGSGRTRYLKFVVDIADEFDRYGATSTITATNSALPAPVVTAVGDMHTIFVNWDNLDDKDYVGTNVYIGTTSGFTPGPSNLAWTGHQSQVTLKKPAGTYYVKVGNFDSFSSVPDFFSTAIAVTVGDMDAIDSTAPATPTGLTVTSDTIGADDGTVFGRLLVNWTDNTETDLAGYDVQVKEGAGNYSSEWVTNSKYVLRVTPGQSYTVKVCAFDRAGNKSAYVTASAHTAAKDTVAPANVANLTAVSQFKKIKIKYDQPTEFDYAHSEIWRNTVNNSGTATRIGFSRSDHYIDNEASLDQDYYYWVKHVDFTGNKSNFGTAAGPVQASRVQDADTDQTALAAPTGLSLGQDNVDVDDDGKVDIALLATWTDLGLTCKSYEAELSISSTSGGTYTVIDHKNVRTEKARFEAKSTKWYKFRVRGFNAFGAPGTWSALSTAFQPAKKSALPTDATWQASNAITALPLGVLLRWVGISDKDYKKTLVYRNTVNDSSTASVVGHTDGNQYRDDDGLVAGTTYYYWLKHVDRTDNVSFNFSAVKSVTWRYVQDGDTDQTALSAIGTVTITQDNIDVDGDGKVDIGGLVTWTDLGASYKHYEVELSQSATSGGAYTLIDNKTLKQTTARFGMKTTKWYKARVRGFNAFGAPGTWSALSAAFNPAGKTALPTVPSGVTLTARAKHFLIEWTQPVDADIRRYELYINTANSQTGGTLVKAGNGDHFPYSKDLVVGTAYYAFMRSIDTTGNPSAWVAASNNPQTYRQAQSADLENNAVIPSKALLGDTENKVRDSDCVDISLWSTPSGVTLSSNGTSLVTESRYKIVSTPQVAAIEIDGGIDIQVKAGKKYYVEALLSSSDLVTSITGYSLSINWYSMSNTGVPTLLSNSVVNTGSGVSTTLSGIVTAPTNARRAQLVAKKTSAENLGLGLSGPIFKKAIEDNLTDQAALAAPGTVTITQDNVDVDGDGKVDIAGLVSWSDVSALYKQYETELSISSTSGGTYTVIDNKNSKQTTARFVMKSTKWYKARVRGFNAFGAPGSWSALSAAFQPAKKTSYTGTAPAGLTALAKPKCVKLKWTMNSDADYRETIVLRDGVEIDRVSGAGYTDQTELTVGSTYSYTIQHVDTCGNVSTASSAATAVYRGAQTTDIGPDQVTPSRTAPLDRSNMVRGADMTELSLYTSTGGTLATAASSNVSESTNELSVPATTSASTISTLADIPVKANKWYYVNGHAGTTNGQSAGVYLQVLWFSDAAGTVFITSDTLPVITGTTVTEFEKVLKAPAGARRAMLRAGKQASGTAADLLFYGPIFRKAANTEMIPAGAVLDANTDQTAPNAPGTPAISAVTADFDDDGTIEGGLHITFTAPGSGVNVKQYEVEIWRANSAGTAGSLTGYSFWKKIHTYGLAADTQANARKFYKACVRAKSFNGTTGADSAFTSIGIQPSTYTTAISTPAAPTVTAKVAGNVIRFPKCTDKNYKETIINRTGTGEIARVTGNRYVDRDDALVQGTGYTYTIQHVTNTDVASSASPASSSVVYKNVQTGDIEDGSVSDAKADQTAPGTPSAPSISTITADVDGDGTVDTGLRVTMTLPSGVPVKFFEIELQRSATLGGTYTAFGERKPVPAEASGSTIFDFKANSAKFYKARYRAISFAGIKGSYSSLTTTGVQPLQYLSSIPTPTLTVTPKPKGMFLEWSKWQDNTYLESIVFRDGVELMRLKGNSYTDNDELNFGQSYSYTVQHMDRQNRVGTVSSAAAATYRGLKSTDSNTNDPAAMCENNDFSLGPNIGWSGPGDIVSDAVNAFRGTYVMTKVYAGVTINYTNRNTLLFPVRAGEQYYIGGMLKTDGSFAASTGLGYRLSLCSDAAGTTEITTVPIYFLTSPNTTWTEYGGVVTIPATSTIAFARLEPTVIGMTAGQVWWSHCFCRPEASKLVKAGGITDTKTDQTAPGAPGVPVLTTITADLDGDGTIDTGLTATWTAATSGKHYELEVWEATAVGTSGSLTGYTLWKKFPVFGLTTNFKAKANRFYKACVRTKSFNGTTGTDSAFTSVGVQPTSYSNTMPTVTWPSTAIWLKPKHIALKWNQIASTFKHAIEIVVYRNTTNNSATATEIGTAPANAQRYVDSDGDLVAGTTYYYWLKVRDAVGNVSASFSAVQSITFYLIGSGSLRANVDPENKIGDGDFDQGEWDDVWPFVSGGTIPTNFWLWTGDSQTGGQSLILDNLVTGGSGGGTIPSLYVSSDYLPVKAGQNLAWEITRRTNDGSSTVGLYYRILWFKRDKTASATTSTDTISNGSIPSAWTTSSGIVAVPSDACYAVVRIFHHSTSTTRYLILDRVSLRKAEGHALIPNGTLVEGMTDQTTPATVTSLALSSLTADIDGDGSIDAGLSLAITNPNTGVSIKRYIVEVQRDSAASPGTYTFWQRDTVEAEDTADSLTTTYTFKANKNRSHKCRVRPVSFNGKKGAWSALSGAATPTTVSGYNGKTGSTPTAAAIANAVKVTWALTDNAAAALDLTIYKKTEILVGGVSVGFAHGTFWTDTTPRTPGTSYTYTVKHYDVHGNVTTVSAGSAVTWRNASAVPATGDFDTTALAVPGSFTYAQDTSYDINGDGTIDMIMKVGWAAVTNAVGYEIEISRSTTLGGTYTVVGLGGIVNTLEHRHICNVNYFYKARVRARNAYGQPGSWTALSSGVQPAKKSATTLTAPASIGATMDWQGRGFYWTDPTTQPDYLHSEVQISFFVSGAWGAWLNSKGTSGGVDIVVGNYYFYPWANYTDPLRIQVRHVDRSLNATSWTVYDTSTLPPNFGTSFKIGNTSIADNAINERYLSSTNTSQSCGAATKTLVESVAIVHGTGANLVEFHATFRNVSGGSRTMDVQFEDGSGNVYQTYTGIVLADNAMVTLLGCNALPGGSTTTYRLYVTMTTAGSVNNTKVMGFARRR
jgi:predicted phage tail protein